MILRILWIALASYFVYKIVFDFIIPVVGTTRRVRKAFNDVRQQQEASMRAQYGQNPSPGQAPKADPSDYIEFEEIK
jgi:hypothetical protein